MYNAYIGTLQNVRKHSNADRLLVGEIFGNQVIVGLDYQEGETLVYFPEGGRLNKDFCAANNLLRSQGGYISDDNCRVRAEKLRGEVSDGLPLRLETLAKFVGVDNVKDLKVGDRFDTLEGIKICEKYVPPRKTPGAPGTKSQNKRFKRGETPTFQKHYDTLQLQYNLHKFKKGDFVIINSKCHGTSARFSLVLDEIELPRWKRLVNKVYPVFPTQEYRFMHGTRNVILGSEYKCDFHSQDFRESIAKQFYGKLNKDECVYAEVCGYETLNKSIMPAHNTEKLADKAFTKRYGKSMIYDYGCKNGEYKIFIYRIAIVNPDGILYDLPWDTMKRRAEEMGFEVPTEFARFVYDGNQGDLLMKAKNWAERQDPIGNHWQEGVCVRNESSYPIRTYKLKSVVFKICEGIQKDSDVADLEESS